MSIEDPAPSRSAYKLEYVEFLLGILVLQDVQMGMLMAFLPALAGRGSILVSAGILIQVLLGKKLSLVHSTFLYNNLTAGLSFCETKSPF